MAGTKPILTPDWMRISEAAAQIGCHQKTLYRRFRRGSSSVAGVRVINLDGVLRVNRADWAASLERNAAKQQEKAA